MAKTKLYNMDKQEWREGNFERGSVWRSDIAYKCEICHTKTNRWIMGGWPGMGPRILCPGDLYQEHDELESSLSQYQTLDGQIRDYEKNLDGNPKVNRVRAQNMIDNLHAQRELLEAKVSELREIMFIRKLDNIESLDDNPSIREFYPGSRYVGDKKSLKGTTE